MAQWNVTDAVYLQEFDVSAKETEPQDVFFKPDGTKMYVIGSVGQAVDEYDLGTQWDVTTAVWLHEFSVAAKEIYPTGIFFKPDGTKMYVVGSNGDSVDEYDLGTQWDVTTAVYLHEFSVAAKGTGPRGVFFKPDGTKMYVVDSDDDSVDEYDLGTQWDVSTAVWLQEISIAAKDTFALGLFFKPDGTKMYIVGANDVTVDEYDLGTQWDVTTAVYLHEFSVAVEDATPSGGFIKPDGSKMYIVGFTGQTVYEYDLL